MHRASMRNIERLEQSLREQLRTIDPHNLENEEVVALSDAYHQLMYWKALSPLFEEMDLLEFGWHRNFSRSGRPLCFVANIC